MRSPRSARSSRSSTARKALAEEPRIYKTKSRNAQEAHEAIRPTSAAITPQQIEGKIDAGPVQALCADLEARGRLPDGACACSTPSPSTCSPGRMAQRHLLRANGSTLVKPGYIAVYQEGRDDNGRRRHRTASCRRCRKAMPVKLLAAARRAAFHRAAAALLRSLAGQGAGGARHRPSSTYASIISTLKDREYVDMDARRFIPTDIGKIVNGFLSKYFTQVRRVRLHRRDGRRARRRLARRGGLAPAAREVLEAVHRSGRAHEKNVSREEVAQSRELGIDPASGKPVSVRMGRFGPFVQIGTKDDEEKPRFAGLRPGQKMDKITLDEAMQLFLLPRKLGTTEGEPITPTSAASGPT
jgi:DNA topoisomerase-1